MVRDLERLERNRGCRGVEIGARPLERQSLLEVPPDCRHALAIEQIDRAVATLDDSVHGVLMPIPQAVDRRESVLKHEPRVMRAPREAMHEIVHAAFAVFVLLDLDFEALARRE